MTEVAGPPVPPLFSSLPIRGADASTAMAGAEKANLEVSCNMVQAFEFPKGRRIAAWRCSPAGAHVNEFPDTLSRSPLRSGPTAGQQQYGSHIGSLQARKFSPNATCGGLIPVPMPRLINPAALTK